MRLINNDIMNKISTGEYKNINDKLIATYFEILANYNRAIENKNLISEKYHYNELLTFFHTPLNAAYILSNLTTIKKDFILDKVTESCYRTEYFFTRHPLWTRISKDTACNFNFYILQALRGVLPDCLHRNYEYGGFPIKPIAEALFILNGVDVLKDLNKPKEVEGKKEKGFLFVEQRTGVLYFSGYKLTKKNTSFLYTLKKDGLYDIYNKKFIKIADKCEDCHHIFNYADIEYVNASTNIGVIETTYQTKKE